MFNTTRTEDNRPSALQLFAGTVSEVCLVYICKQTNLPLKAMMVIIKCVIHILLMSNTHLVRKCAGKKNGNSLEYDGQIPVVYIKETRELSRGF